MKKETKENATENQVAQVVEEADLLNKTIHVTLYNDIINPWFEAKQIAECLGVKNVSQMLKQSEIPDSQKAIFLKYTLGGNQKSLFITESALYSILMKSRKQIAIPMQEAISEHLKKIRITGASIEMGREEEAVNYYFSQFSDDIKLAMIKELQEKNKELQECYNDLLNTEGLMSMNAVSKELGGIGLKTLFSYLRSNKIMFYKDNINIPYQRFMDQKLFQVKESKCNDGKYRPVTYATKKGLEYIRKIMRKDGLLVDIESN